MITMNRWLLFGLCGTAMGILFSAAAPAGAQTPSGPGTEAPAVPPRAVDPKPCSDPATEAHRNSSPSERSKQGDSSSKQTNETLSDKLSNSNGVLCPTPEVDPGVKAPPPNAATTPVIPPPGSPGGDPTVQPK